MPAMAVSEAATRSGRRSQCEVFTSSTVAQRVSGMQDQLLDAPIQQFRHVDYVFGRAGHGVNPAKLFQLLAGLSKDAEHLAVEIELVDAAGPGIRTVEHLVR